MIQGDIQIAGSDIKMGSGSIEASGNISATGSTSTMTAKTISANTMQAGKILAKGADGVISLGDVGNRVTAIIEGDIELRGSDIKIGSGSIFASGDINATGSNSKISAVRVEAQTVNASKILAKGADGIISLGDIGKRVTAIIEGDLKVKGSDITIASGSISASGDINAGWDGTGSFDHIVTTNNTIEFRDAISKSTVKGYLKFDDTYGFQALGANKAEKLVQAHKLRNARTIGGQSFNGTANINLPGVNIAGTQDTSGNAGTATKFAASKTIGGAPFDGSMNITPNISVNSYGYKNSNTSYKLSPKDFQTYDKTAGQTTGWLVVDDGIKYGADIILPVGSSIFKRPGSIIYASEELDLEIWQCLFNNDSAPVKIVQGTTNAMLLQGAATKNFDASTMYLQIMINNDSGGPVKQFGGMISYINK